MAIRPKRISSVRLLSWMINYAELNVPDGGKCRDRVFLAARQRVEIYAKMKGLAPAFLTATPEICVFWWMAVSIYGKYLAFWSTEGNKLSRHEGSGWPTNKPGSLTAKSYIPQKNFRNANLTLPTPVEPNIEKSIRPKAFWSKPW